MEDCVGVVAVEAVLEEVARGEGRLRCEEGDGEWAGGGGEADAGGGWGFGDVGLCHDGVGNVRLVKWH